MSRGLSAAARERVRDALAPGGRVVRVRPLHGGVSSSVQLVNLETETGQREAVIVRRYGAYAEAADPEACAREFKLLGVLRRHGVPAPAPLVLDAQGGPFGAPTIVMSRLPGRPLMAPRDLLDYLTQLASALLQLHNLPTDDLRFLPDQRLHIERALRDELAPSNDRLHASVWASVQAEWQQVARQKERRTLVHGDYWPGNLLWRRGRLSGIVDWEQPRLGDPTRDVATCRSDLSILFGVEAGDAFLERYLAAGGHVDNLEFFDLLVATWALREIDEWATVYPLFDRADLTPELARRRVRSFARRALAARERSRPA